MWECVECSGFQKPGLQPGFALFSLTLGWAEKRRCDSLKTDYTAIPEEWQIAHFAKWVKIWYTLCRG
jgi:hypothetical protein